MNEYFFILKLVDDDFLRLRQVKACSRDILSIRPFVVNTMFSQETLINRWDRRTLRENTDRLNHATPSL